MPVMSNVQQRPHDSHVALAALLVELLALLIMVVVIARLQWSRGRLSRCIEAVGRRSPLGVRRVRSQATPFCGKPPPSPQVLVLAILHVLEDAEGLHQHMLLQVRGQLLQLILLARCMQVIYVSLQQNTPFM